MAYQKASYDKVCVWCGKQYTAHRVTSQTCSRRCKDTYYRARHGIKCNLNTEPYHKLCVICGKPFDTFRESVIRCSTACSKKRHNKQTNGNMQELKTCSICGKEIISWKTDRVTCGDSICQRIHKRQYEKNRLSKIGKYTAKPEPDPVMVEGVCGWCGNKFLHDSRMIRKYCGQECARKANNKKREKRIPKSQRVDCISIDRLFKRDGGKCYICGCDCDKNDWRLSDNGNKYPGDRYPTIDHVLPVSKGGLDAWDNVRLACWKCNTEKADGVISAQPLDKTFAYSAKYAKTLPKKTAQYTLDGKLIRIWDSTAQIRRETGLSDKHIQNVCRKDRYKTGNAYGFRWEYVNG